MKHPRLRRGIITALVSVIAIIILVTAIGLAVVYSGAPTGVATDPHWTATA